MSKYMTRQRKILLDFLSKHTDETLSARQIADALSKDGISTSAVYRNLSALEADGVVKRFAKNDLRESVYRYVGAEECKNSLHLSCKICGRSIHMDDADAEQLIKNVSKHKGFTIEKSETVLYGICEDCSK